MHGREERFIESLLGMIGVSWLLVGLMIQTVSIFLLEQGWLAWVKGSAVLVLFVLTLACVRYTAPSRVREKAASCGKWMLGGSLLGFVVSWFTALAGVLLLISGILCLWRSRKQKERLYP